MLGTSWLVVSGALQATWELAWWERISRGPVSLAAFCRLLPP